MKPGARISGALLAGLIAACGGLPEAPEWDVVVAAPFASERLTVRDFLPDGVDTLRHRGETVFALPPTSGGADLALRDICPVCPGGSTSSIPAFSHGIGLDVDLLPGLVSMDLRSGELRLQVTNGLPFTVLGDAGDGSGSLEVVVREHGTGDELGRRIISGPGTGIAPGQTLTISIDLPSREVAHGIRVELTLSSPRIDLAAPVVLDPDDAVGVEGTVDSLRVAAVTMQVNGVGVQRGSPIDLSLDQGTRDLIDERLLGADVEFELLHDLAIEGPFRVTLANSEGSLFTADPVNEVVLGEFTFVADQIQKSTLDAATIQQIVDFDETWIGYEATGTGTLFAPPGAGPLTRFEPGSGFGTRVRVSTRFRVGG